MSQVQTTTDTGGTKHDAGKPRLELIAPSIMEALGSVLAFGAKKYADRNWEKGISWGRVFGALMRHMWAWWRGEKADPETGFSHLWHAACCIMFLIEYERRTAEGTLAVSLDDRPQADVV
jgi:hypothetical protein